MRNRNGIIRSLGIIVLAAVSFIGLAGCGGSSSSGGNGSDDATLTTADVNSVAAGFFSSQYAAAQAAITDLGAQFDQSAALSVASSVSKGTQSGTIPINEVYNCQESGHITSTGNFTWSITTPDPPATTPEASASIDGQLMQQVSDPTNNLNDCEVGNDVILDGTVYSQYSYDWTQSGGGQAVLMTDGTIGLNRRGPTGGLVMISDDCSIFFTVRINVSASSVTSGSATGTICGESYSYTF